MKKLNDDFCEECNYQEYLLQVMVNGQLTSFKQTIKEIKSTSLIDFILSHHYLLTASEIEAIKQTIEKREV